MKMLFYFFFYLFLFIFLFNYVGYLGWGKCCYYRLQRHSTPIDKLVFIRLPVSLFFPQCTYFLPLESQLLTSSFGVNKYWWFALFINCKTYECLWNWKIVWFTKLVLLFKLNWFESCEQICFIAILLYKCFKN